MKQTTSRHLYQYWNSLRGARVAPRRFEVDPARIAPILAQTFIVECERGGAHRFRLAGTRICEYFGRELRGSDLMDLWEARDRQRLHRLLVSAVFDGAAAVVVFDGLTEDDRAVRFEMVVLPLVHLGNAVNRLLGGIAPLKAPYWLGTVPVQRLRIAALDVVWPDAGQVRPEAEPVAPPPPISRDVQRQFRVLQGGLADSPD